MAHITPEYYLNVYEGKTPSSSISLTTTIKRASDVIDSITGFKLQTTMDLNTVHPFIRANVEKSVAALTEFYILKGGYETMIAEDTSDVKIGSFSYSMKASKTGEGAAVEIPDNVLRLLVPTGLLYAGVNTASGGVYYDN